MSRIYKGFHIEEVRQREQKKEAEKSQPQSPKKSIAKNVKKAPKAKPTPKKTPPEVMEPAAAPTGILEQAPEASALGKARDDTAGTHQGPEDIPKD